MLSPNTENTVGYWRILEEESVDLDRIKLREKEKLQIERIIEEKLERDKLERDIYEINERKEEDRTFEINSFTETNNEFCKEAEILIENEEQKNDKSKIQELTLKIESLKEKMEQILKSTQNKIVETHNAQKIVSPTVESQIKVNRNRITKTDKRSENANTEEKEQDRNKFKLSTPVPRKLIRNEILTIPGNKRNEA